tara:strand:- start:495 stop:1934 length:1440 start_codon:yes stop_codon:yes gene_type:complete
MEKKNIDRLFQEKFKDFEAHPSDKVWERLAAREKKKRSVIIPLWFKLGSAAAVILLLLWLGNSVIDKNVSSPLVNENPVLVKDDKEQQPQYNEVNKKVVEQNTTEPAQSSDPEKEKIEKKASKNAAIAEENRNSNTNSQAKKPALNDQKSVVFDENRPKKSSDSGEKLAENQGKQSDFENAENGAVKTEKLSQSETKTTTIAQTESPNIKKKSEEITEAENALEQLEKEKNSEVASVEPEEKDTKRWGVSPRVAPVYYGSFSGSGIDPQFKDNSKEGEVNMSYGVQVSYAVNDRLKIRSGVNKVNLSYNTDNIGFSPDFRSRSLSSINYSKGADFIDVGDASTFSSIASLANAEIPNQAIDGKLSQDLGYYEVPLEIEYALVDKKIALQVIGGLSTLFLNDNKISIEDGDYTTPLGTSNSLNNVSFSTNVGLGIDYNLSEKLQFNLEPMFKYQLNSYKNTVSDFKPYYLGLYTGVSFKF